MGTKEKIIQQAILLFGQHGYDRVSLRQLSEAVGITSGALYHHFPSKEALWDSIVEYIDRNFKHYAPTPEEVCKMLQTQTPEEILNEFVGFYYKYENSFQMEIYRLFYVCMYNNSKLLDMTTRLLIQEPVENICSVIMILQEVGAVPAGDAKGMAELWNRTSVICGYIYFHDEQALDYETYIQMVQFFIDMILRGVHLIPVENIDMTWNSIYQLNQQQEESKTKQQILQVALDLFSERGYVAVGMRQIARQAGIHVSSIYNHFAGKSEIICSLVKGLLDGIQQYNLSNPAFKAVLDTKDAVKVILSLSTSYPPMEQKRAYQLYRILFREQYQDETLRDFFLESLQNDIETITNMLEDLVAAGHIRRCCSRQIATAYVYAMCSLTIDATAGQEGPGDERVRIVALLVSLVVRGHIQVQ